MAVAEKIEAILREVAEETSRQREKWGIQRHPDGTGGRDATRLSEWAREACILAFANNKGTWKHVLYEEVCEALAEADPARLREELVQVAAVAASWIEAIDSREGES